MGGLACGCAASPARVAGPPVHIDLPPSIVTADEVTTEAELEARGERALLEQRWKDAADAYRLLLAADPVGPRASEHMFDLGLSLVSLWFTDLICLELGAPELVRHTDRLSELEADAGRDPHGLRAAIELVEDTRQRFQLNVSEDLACEALCYRLEHAVAR